MALLSIKTGRSCQGTNPGGIFRFIFFNHLVAAHFSPTKKHLLKLQSLVEGKEGSLRRKSRLSRCFVSAIRSATLLENGEVQKQYLEIAEKAAMVLEDYPAVEGLPKKIAEAIERLQDIQVDPKSQQIIDNIIAAINRRLVAGMLRVIQEITGHTSFQCVLDGKNVKKFDLECDRVKVEFVFDPSSWYSVSQFAGEECIKEYGVGRNPPVLFIPLNDSSKDKKLTRRPPEIFGNLSFKEHYELFRCLQAFKEGTLILHEPYVATSSYRQIQKRNASYKKVYEHRT
ncbi:MAG: hypothetical protein GYA55_03005 [SAR324 cluster bacterium]|uniref:Uncharacterized protein n=1 Tax=SAR324 cluster bacterium TaxID=2024889 RepID=A0A7X9IKM2_9DELT|nr:hypothetical protein [SAR324 cluster bacterium]